MPSAILPTLKELQENIGPGPAAGRTRRLWIAGALALACAAAAMAVHVHRLRRNRVQYASDRVARGDLAVTVAATGILEPVTSFEVGSEVSGRVLRELVEVNDVVRKGQVMAEIDPEALDSGLEQSRAQLRGAQDAVRLAQATADQSEKTHRRNQLLGQQGILAQADMDQARSVRDRDNAALASAREDARVARSAVDLTASKRQKATIRAPIAGVVLARLMEPGQTVTAGFQTPVLFRLAQDMSRMRLKVDIDEADVSHIRGGQAATFTVEAYPGRDFPSQVDSLQLEPKVSQNVVTYVAVLSVDNTDRALLPGMTCSATIQTETRRAVLLVPNSALRFSPLAGPGKPPLKVADGKHRVWVLKDGQPAPVEVKTGATDGRRTEILEGGLQEGADVLTDATAPS